MSTTENTLAVGRMTELYAWASAAAAAGAFVPSAVVERINRIDPFLFWAVMYRRVDLILSAAVEDADREYDRVESVGPDPIQPDVVSNRGMAKRWVWMTSTDTVLDVTRVWPADWSAYVVDPEHHRATTMSAARARAVERWAAWSAALAEAYRRPEPPAVVDDVHSVPEARPEDNRW